MCYCLIPGRQQGPITRAGNPNWVFRLSLDDKYAGMVMVKHADEVQGARSPILLLERTGWGKNNHTVMTTDFAQRGHTEVPVIWFQWGVGPESADIIMRQVVSGGHDVILLVANANEGAAIVQAMARLPQKHRVPIISHWGITGGDFVTQVPASMRQGIELMFLQTRFSLASERIPPFAQGVWRDALALHPDMPADRRRIAAPAGFIHAFDLGLLFAAAGSNVDPTLTARQARDLLRQNLESLEGPIVGLVNTYDKPFDSFSAESTDAHEALSIDDFVLARYGDDNAIELLKVSSSNESKSYFISPCAHCFVLRLNPDGGSHSLGYRREPRYE